MRALRALVLALLLALCQSGASTALPVGGSPPAAAPTDQMTALLATLCNNCWGDAGAFVTTAPTIQSVVWNCTVMPCTGGGPLASTIFGSDSEGPSAIVTNWSGGAYDNIHHNLLVTGGGHQGYWGNEVYGFNTPTLTWSRLTVPGTPPGNVASVDTCSFSSGTQPASLHNYGALAFVGGGSGQLFVTNGASSGPAGSGCVLTWTLDLGTLTWTQQQNINAAGGPGFLAAWEAASNRVYIATEDNNGFQFFPTGGTGTPTLLGGAQIPDFHMAAAIDPVHRLMVAYSGLSTQIQIFDLVTGAKTTPTTTGGTARICETSTSVASAGIAWDTVAGKFVAWCGDGAGGAGANVFTLTPVTWAWTKVTIGGGNTVTPGVPQTNGTFGRWVYDSDHDCFLLVNAWNQSTLVFKGVGL